MAEAVLAAERLSKRYPLYGGLLRRRIGMVEAVQDVELEVRFGETVGLVGESGSGKSTLARLLVGLLPPTDGSVRWSGRPLSALRGRERLEARRHVQMVFQDPLGSLDPRLTIGETLAEPFEIHRVGRRIERRLQVERLLQAVELPIEYARRLPRELSGGERQRVGIARAIALEPRVLVCDEPIASLDVTVGASILRLLAHLHAQRGMAVLFISHDLRAVATLCGRIAVMQAGRLIEVAPTPQLLAAPSHRYTQRLLRAAALDLELPDDL